MRKYAAMLVALLVSAFIYLFYRTNHTLINELFALVFGDVLYGSLKSIIQSNLKLPSQFIYSLPGALWVWVISIASRDVFIFVRGRKISLVFLPIIVAIGFELFQYFNWINGHFDWWDIFYALSFWLLSFVSFNKQKRSFSEAYSTIHYNLVFAGSYLLVFFAHVTS